MKSIFNEWNSNVPPFAFHSFTGDKGSYYSPRRSLVLRYNDDSLYQYANAVTYTTFSHNVLPLTSGLFYNTCAQVGSAPQQAHIIVYADESDFLDWHTDKPLVKSTSVTVLRIGGPRKVQIRDKSNIEAITEFIIYEGDVWIMTWEAQQTYEHRVPKISKKKYRFIIKKPPHANIL